MVGVAVNDNVEPAHDGLLPVVNATDTLGVTELINEIFIAELVPEHCEEVIVTL